MVVCLKREIWREVNYSKKKYAERRLWGGSFYFNLIDYWRANLPRHHVFQGKQNIVLWPDYSCNMYQGNCMVFI